ncbi:MAG: NUDIX domain-containing protein [Actinomycetaceae bacterium]|nr:NUDIX domain-containing protein [Actinomycetaceae bacterium]
MPIPEFVVELRKRIGHAQLWLSGVTAVITNEDDTRVLLVKRADNGEWTPVTGIIDPGEQPANAAAREALEEANVHVEPLRVISIDTVGPVVYDNGDVTRYLDISFHMRYLGGDPTPADGENSEVKWFDVNALPPMNERFTTTVARALAEPQPTIFEFDAAEVERTAELPGK